MVRAASHLLVVLTGSAGQCARLHRLSGALLLPRSLIRQAGLLLEWAPLLLLLLLLMRLRLLLLLPHAILIRRWRLGSLLAAALLRGLPLLLGGPLLWCSCRSGPGGPMFQLCITFC
jgi:hypothetical protein